MGVWIRNQKLMLSLTARFVAIEKSVLYAEILFHGPETLVVDHCARIESAPFVVALSAHVLTPAVNWLILAAKFSNSVPSFLMIVVCEVSQVFGGWVPNVKVELLTITLIVVRAVIGSTASKATDSPIDNFPMIGALRP
ncbi:MAG: hypothetical protein AB1792_00330 [Candidatus Zixiibacteriota bacterium]